MHAVYREDFEKQDDKDVCTRGEKQRKWVVIIHERIKE